MKQVIRPTLEDLRLECVLVQAWKKTAAHIRQHSWYSDTLELDFQSLRLPSFIDELQDRLNAPSEWQPTLLDIVPAPKSQKWEVRDGIWHPCKGERVGRKLRPLAHVGLQEQVVATAMMMCLADRVESAAGDPRLTPEDPENRKRVLRYGHRLFCDANNGGLQHRWGSSKVYRQFYQDYQTFLERPKLVTAELKKRIGVSGEIAIVASDLSKFYDRVRPSLLAQKVRSLQLSSEEAGFFDLFQRVFSWQWRDQKRASKYGSIHKISDYESIALPQGLAAAGFFANVVLRDFEDALRSSIGTTLLSSGTTRLVDVCYYVDDLRLVLQVENGLTESSIEGEVCGWVQGLLDRTAPGLLVERDKTKATVEGREKKFLVQQSKAASRIQKEVSGTFDMLHGTELIGAIEGFFHTQQRYSPAEGAVERGRSGLLVGISDLRDDTAARFAAGKYRRTFRSLRPLLSDEAEVGSSNQETSDGENETKSELPSQLVLSRQQLDERAQLFAAVLIEEWVSNPGNVRLLRIALDIFPDVTFLRSVLELLKDGWALSGSRGPGKEVRLYCLSELFRAGATETGMVGDGDCLPAGVSVTGYHDLLVQEATAIFESFVSHPGSAARFPWYFMQQVFLYLIARDAFPSAVRPASRARQDKLARHKQMARFLTGMCPASLSERCVLLVIAVSAFGHDQLLNRIAETGVSSELLRTLADVSPEIAASLWGRISARSTDDQKAVARMLGLSGDFEPLQGPSTVAALAQPGRNPFYEEENVLELADALLECPYSDWPDNPNPWQVSCKIQGDGDGRYFGAIERRSISFLERQPRARHLFAVPDWCDDNADKQRQQLGMLLRYALRASSNFHAGAQQRAASAIKRYRTPLSHWEQQRYSGFQGRAAFGPAWLPMSSEMETILFELLRWPGAGVSSPLKSIAEIKTMIRSRLNHVRDARGPATRLTFLEQVSTWPAKPPVAGWERPLRVGIVQSITPDSDDYSARLSDPRLVGDISFRRRQRRHLAAMMDGVAQMLRVRETHRQQVRQDGRVLDLLVFPELAIHPLDVETLILPFVRSYKCMVLCGLVYHTEPALPGSPLINSCLWMIPEWSRSAGFHVRRLEQGKKHLAVGEDGFTPVPVGFRPVQWLVEYQWSSDTEAHRPLTISASICYDATDLALASDLKDRSDFWIVCALNRDVGTFDRMAEGLHYHMFQPVMVVNNGQFGGSSLFAPMRESHHRQVLHLHGQPQATIAFAELSPRKIIDRPFGQHGEFPIGDWKTPPAAWTKR